MFTLPDKTVVLNLPEQVELNKTDISDLKTNEANNATEIATNATNVSELQTRTATLESRTNSVNGSILTGKLQAEKDSEFGSNLVIDGGLTLNSPSDLHFKRGDTDYSDFNEFKELFYKIYYQGKYTGGYISGDFVDSAINSDLAKLCTGYQSIFEKCEFELPTYNFPDIASRSIFDESFYRVNGLTNVTLGDGDDVFAENMFRFPNSIQSVKVREGKSFRPLISSTMFGGYEGNSVITDIEGIDFSKCIKLDNIFYRCTKLKTLKCTHFRLSFDISFSTQFEQSDLVVIIGSLDSVTTPQTLTMGATNLAKLTQDQILVATGKGWTLA